MAVDTAVALLCYAATALPMIDESPRRPWVFALAALGSFPLAWRRRYPIAVALAVGAGTIALSLLHLLHDIPYGQVVATYTFASLSPPLLRLIGIAGTALGIAVSLLAGGTSKLWDIGYVGVAFVAAYAVGTGARARRDRIAMLEERERRLAGAHEAAAARERERIGRDMHDILAHSISLIVVQAEAGPVVVRSDPDRAEAVFDAIAVTGRDALGQLRRTLGLLRSDGAARAPAPELDGVAHLVAQARTAGLSATVDETGQRRPVPPEVAGAAYRIVQESLTNTLKHAGARSVRVGLRWQEAALRVEVADDGRGPSAGDAAGHGLIGMRERVAACGGSLSTGTGADGTGFLVTATLPVAPAVAPDA
jgi:signal transduction histidine kinase